MSDKHEEYQYKADTSDTVIVFIHGIQGSPTQFNFIIDDIKGLYSIYNLLLPGHGKTVKEFAKASMSQWQNYVDTKILELQQEYKNIILVGHSMGCLLSAQTAVTYPKNIRGLFMMAIPLSIRISIPYINNHMAVAFSKSNRDEIIAAARTGNSVSATNPFSYILGVPRYIELLRKSMNTRKVLEKIDMPVSLIHSENDEIVRKKSLSYAANMNDMQTYIIKNSRHYWYSKQAQEQIIRILKQFIVKATTL